LLFAPCGTFVARRRRSAVWLAHDEFGPLTVPTRSVSVSEA
jgi:hypothetical protein